MKRKSRDSTSYVAPRQKQTTENTSKEVSCLWTNNDQDKNLDRFFQSPWRRNSTRLLQIAPIKSKAGPHPESRNLADLTQQTTIKKEAAGKPAASEQNLSELRVVIQRLG